MMKAADLGQCHDVADRHVGSSTMIRCVFLEGEMRATAMVVAEGRRQESPQMLGIQDDHGIEALATNGPNQPFDKRVLPGIGASGHELSDRHALSCAKIPRGWIPSESRTR